jgi:hypothetical protein
MISRRILAAAASLCALSAPAHAQTGSFSSVSINPAAGTTNQGLVINQTAPSGGTSTNSTLFNSVTVTNPGFTGAPPGSGFDSFGQIKNQLQAFRVNYAVQGGNSNNGAVAAATFVTGDADSYGAAIGATANANIGGHILWGVIGYGTVWPGASVGSVIGVESEIGISTGGSATYRLGVSANSQGPVQGSVLDAAFAASSIANQLPGPGTTTPFQHLIALTSNLYSGGVFPIAATGDLLFSDAAGTIAHGINLPSVTVTGNILNFPNMAIGGNGTASFGTGASGLPGTGVLVSCASCGRTEVFGTPNGTTGADGITIKDSSTDNIMFTGVAEASNTVTRFGQATGNWGEMVTFGSTNAGLMIGTLTNQPLIIGTDNTARMTLSGAGALTVSGTINGVTLDNAAWQTYRPNVASSAVGSTPAIYTVNSARYKQIGKTVTVSVVVTVTDQGVGAAGSILIDLPFAASSVTNAAWAGTSYEFANIGRSGRAFVVMGGTNMSCRDATATTYIATTNAIVAEVTYEIP